MSTKLYIKNMVCDRCKMAVGQVLTNLSLTPLSIELGEATIAENLQPNKKEALRSDLQKIGFELLDDKKQKIIEQMKNNIIKLVRSQEADAPQNLSAYLEDKLLMDYSALSKLFREVTGKTVERYYIEQRVEYVKELIKYDELSLTQIAYQMHYSSVAHLSTQFKNVTGMTPSEFKSQKKNTRKSIDQI